MLIESRSRARTRASMGGEHRSPLSGVRARVLISFLALLVISTAASVIVLRQVLLSRIDEQVKAELADDVAPLRDLAEADRADGEPFMDLESLFDAFLARNPPPVDGVFATFVGREPYEVVSDSGSVTASGLPAAVRGLGRSDEPTSGETETAGGGAMWVAIPVSIDDQRGHLVAAALTGAERDQVEDAVRLAIGVAAVVCLIASLFIWLAAGRAIAPLNALSRTARTISETDLSARIPVRGSDEIAELGRTFNGMLDRLETAFAGQKDFLTDVSHELRTPITVIRGYLETLGDSEAEREEATAVVQDELDRMSRYVDDLLLLTKAARPDFLRLSPIDLDLFTHDLFAKARNLGNRDWRLDGAGVGIVVADQHRLTQAVMNLADNAVRYTTENDAIWVGSSLIGDVVRLWVRDEGPGIPEEDQDRIFNRFARAGSYPDATSQGYGLGLAIVKAVAEAHGGHVELESEPGVGATFTIVLPASPRST